MRLLPVFLLTGLPHGLGPRAAYRVHAQGTLSRNVGHFVGDGSLLDHSLRAYNMDDAQFIIGE